MKKITANGATVENNKYGETVLTIWDEKYQATSYGDDDFERISDIIENKPELICTLIIT